MKPSAAEDDHAASQGTETIQLRLLRLLLPVAVLTAILVAWQAIVWHQDISHMVLPSPFRICEASWRDRATLFTGLRLTATASMAGLGLSILIGTLTAFVFSTSRAARLALYPYAILLQTVPIVAIAPLIIIGFGRGFVSITSVACLISLFPIISNTTAGLLSVDKHLFEFFQLQGATWWQVLWKLRLPTSLPYLIAGIRISSGSAIVGAIVGEFFVGSTQPGLGYLIGRYTANADTPELYAAVFFAAAFGVLTFSVVNLTGELVLRRWFGMTLSEAK